MDCIPDEHVRFRLDERLAETSAALLTLKPKSPFRQIARGEIDGRTVAISYHLNGLHVQVSFLDGETGEWTRYTLSTETLIRHCFARLLEQEAASSNDQDR